MLVLSSIPLKIWNEQGLIPGPEENETDFVQRALYCLELIQKISNEKKQDFPFQEEILNQKKFLEEAWPKTVELYGIKPDWIPLFFSNVQLSPWHGGCAWIFQLKEDAPLSGFLQLRKAFFYQEVYLHVYKRSELISHEMSHIGRMMYNEPHFEEILAYRTSTNRFRRYFGPLVQSSKESMFFILACSLSILIDLSSLTFTLSVYQALYWFKLLPFILILIAFMRLCYLQNLFDRSLSKLKKLYQDENTASHVLYRLTDKEIKLFARSSLKAIRIYIETNKQTLFRWQCIYTLYPF